MASDREIDKLFALFLFLPLAGVLQFVVANTAGLGASLALGALVLALWVATLSLMVLRGSFFSGFPRPAVGIFGLFAAWTGWITSLPPYFRDDLIIHLEAPKHVLRAGAWTSIPFQPSSVFPNSLLPLNAVLVNAGLDWAVSYIPALFYLAAALLLARWAAAEFGAGWGLFAGAGFLLEPVFFRLSTTAYNDPAVAFFSCAGAYYFWVFLRGGRSADGFKGAVSFAAGSGIKYNAGLLLVVMLVVFFVYSLRSGAFGPRFRVFLASVAAVLLFCGPWWARFAHDRPVAPASLFNGPLQERMALCGESAAYALASPVRLFFQGAEGNRCGYDGGLNPFLLVFGIFCLPFFGGASSDRRFLAASAALFMVSASLLFAITGRYFLPVVPALMFLSAGFLRAVTVRRKEAGIALAAAFLAFDAQGYARSALGFDGWGYLLGRESKGAFLSRNVASYDATTFANKRLTKKETVYFVFLGNQVYYCDVPYYYDAFWDGSTFMRLFDSKADVGSIYGEFGSRGITHLLYNKKIMGRYLANDDLRAKFAAFKEGFAQPVYSDENAELLELARRRP
ncbi:MAG: hypothetical protein HY098_04940 [Nitrospinae bacterium]|nr:hypothetical protein [Nitrospinota bacterium]